MAIAAEQAVQVLGCLEALGIPVDELCGRVGLTRAGVGAPGTRMSRVLFDALFLAAAESSGDALVGLHAGMAKAPADLLFFVSVSQATLGAALREYVRLAPVVDESMVVRMRTSGASTGFCVVESAATHAQALRHEMEYFTGQIVQYLALATAGACRPLEVRMPHPPAAAVAQYERVLGTPVSFRHDVLEIRIRTADLERPIVTANADIARLTRAAAERQLDAAQSRSFRFQVEMALRRRIDANADHSREAVAQALATSVSTMQRRLREERCSFREVRDQVRRAAAEDLLARTDRSVSEIAELLDFADAAAFGKAFRRWTGTSPRRFRTRTRGE